MKMRFLRLLADLDWLFLIGLFFGLIGILFLYIAVLGLPYVVVGLTGWLSWLIYTHPEADLVSKCFAVFLALCGANIFYAQTQGVLAQFGFRKKA
jgi:hypothetical protein